MLAKRRISQGLVCFLLGLALSASSKADVVVSIQQSGSNVVATENGSLDTFALGVNSNANAAPQILSGGGLLVIGNSSAGYSTLNAFGASAPIFGTSGSPTWATSGSGDAFGFAYVSPSLAYVNLPIGYVSGSALSGSATWDNATLSSLGLTSGTYSFSIGSGIHLSTVDLYVGVPVPSPTPEPTSLWLAGTGLAGVLARRNWLRRRGAAAA